MQIPPIHNTVLLEGFEFKRKPPAEPIEQGVFYLWYNPSDYKFRLVKKIYENDNRIQTDSYVQLSEPLSKFSNRILYKLKYEYIPDDRKPERQMKFKGSVGRIFKLSNNNSNILVPHGHFQNTVISRHRSRSRSRSRSRGGNKKTKKTRKNKKRTT